MHFTLMSLNVPLLTHQFHFQHTRLALEKEIDIKRNSIMLDRERCLRIRGLFPSTNLLSGYRNRVYEDLK